MRKILGKMLEWKAVDQWILVLCWINLLALKDITCETLRTLRKCDTRNLKTSRVQNCERWFLSLDHFLETLHLIRRHQADPYLKSSISGTSSTTSSLLNRHEPNMTFEVFGGEFFRLGNKWGRSSRWESVRKISSRLSISVKFRVDKRKRINSFQHGGSGSYARPFRLTPPPRLLK